MTSRAAVEQDNKQYSATIWMGSARQSGWRVQCRGVVMIAANTVARKGFIEG